MDRATRTNLNLLPAQYRRWALFRAALTVWAGVWLIGILAACVVGWQIRSSRAGVHEEVSRLERMHAPMQALEAEMEGIGKRLAEVQVEERAAAGLEIDRPPLALLGIVSRAALACDERLHVRECSLRRKAPASGAAPSDAYVFGIKGAALDLLCVTKFHGVLRTAGMFDRVELRPTTSERIGDLDGYVFEVQCFFE